MRLFVIIFFTILSYSSLAQTGTIKGIVLDSLSESPLAGVFVVVENTSYGTVTEMDGTWQIKVPAGSYNLQFVYYGLQTKEVKGVDVISNEVLELPSIYMGETVEALNEVVISVIRETNTDKAVLNEVRTSEVVANGISQETISKTQDRDAAEVIRRIPGITLSGDRFAMVRGLHQRYNSVMLNNIIAPGAEADSRAFSFDLLPSSMIDRVIVYKTASPELPGDFAGGALRVYTSSVPQENIFKITYASSYRPTTSFKPFYEMDFGSGRWMGYNNGLGNLPAGMPEDISQLPQEEKNKYGKQFRAGWTPDRQMNAPTDQRLNGLFARRITLGNRLRLGSVTSLNYSHTRNHYKAARQVTFANKPDNYMIDNIYDRNVRTGILQNFSLDIGEHTSITFKNTFNHIGSFTYTQRNAEYFPGNSSGYGSHEYRQSDGIRNVYTSLYAGQLGAAHDLSASAQLDWTTGYAFFNEDMPDYHVSGYQRHPETYDMDFMPMYLSSVGSFWSRRYIRLDEKTIMGAANYKQLLPVKLWGEKPRLTAGILFDQKKRIYDYRLFGYKYNSETFDEDNNPSYKYDASGQIMASYIGAAIPIKAFRLSGGIRVENSRQVMNSAYYSTVLGGAYHLDNRLADILPSANLTYDITNKMLVRAAFSKTLNRPEFRELASLKFYNFEQNETVYGNPDLNPDISIYNYDIRYELYPGTGETFSFGLFYKRFINAIEPAFMTSTESVNPSLTFVNLPAARSIGLELECIKSLGNIPFLENILIIKDIDILFNTAIINSTIDMGNTVIQDLSIIQQTNRSMVGQAPYLINAGLFYRAAPLRLTISAMYNIIGKRIIRVGNYINRQVYEMPRHSLDLTVAWQYGKFEWKGGIQNILNQRFYMMQDIDQDNKISSGTDQMFSSWYMGPYYTLGISYRLQ